MPITKKTKEELEAEAKKFEDEVAERENNPLARLMGGPTEQEAPELLADGFVRSKRAQQLRVKDGIMDQINEVSE